MKNNKQMNTKKSIIILILLLAINFNVNAQDKIADKIIAVLGENIVLQSDIDGQFAQYIAQGYANKPELKCQILESLITQKLLQNQAQLDSIEVGEGQVEDELNRRLNYFISQIGSQEKLEQFLGKSVIEFKSDLRDDVRSVIMAQNMQSQITRGVTITPNEIKNFYDKIPVDSLPYFNKEVQLAVIVKKPEISLASKTEAKAKLEELRARVANGEDFATLAILYSQDGSAKSGGELGFVGRGALVKAFEAVAFKLKPGELSQIVETEFGFHIVQLVERRGEQVNVRHILIKPSTKSSDLKKAKSDLDSLYTLLIANELKFIDAAAKYSDDDATKRNGGMMQNAQDGSTKIPTDQLDPNLYFAIENLKVGEIAQPTLFTLPSGEQAYRILQFISKTEPHRANLKDDYQKIQQAALSSKQNKTMEEWFDKKRASTFIKISEDFNYCTTLDKWFAATSKGKQVDK
jgi:peptidyl-prolyl cis-trans isomerase SurA